MIEVHLHALMKSWLGLEAHFLDTPSDIINSTQKKRNSKDSESTPTKQ